MLRPNKGQPKVAIYKLTFSQGKKKKKNSVSSIGKVSNDWIRDPRLKKKVSISSIGKSLIKELSQKTDWCLGLIIKSYHQEGKKNNNNNKNTS